MIRPPFRDAMDARGWCGACYRLEFLRNHGTCSCVCHGFTDNVPVYDVLPKVPRD